MAIFNVEIKAQIDDIQHIKTYLDKNNTRYLGMDHQTDIYFLTGKKRLKLRQGNIENALIYYERAELIGLKESSVKLQQLDRDHDQLIEILKKVLGIKAIVRKKRHIFFIDNVKFHLDDVEKLGCFVEIEAISEDNRYDKEYLRKQCNHYMELLRINKSNLVDRSYSDLLSENL